MRRFIPAVLLCGLGGCYPPALEAEDPPPGEGGLAVHLRGQDCESDGSYSDGHGSHSLALRLQIHNPSREILLFDPRAARLRGSMGGVPPVSPRDPIRVAAGTDADVVVRYLNTGECGARFRVGFDGAFQLGGRETRLGDLRLRPY